MGILTAPLEISHPDGGGKTTVSTAVDTGAAHTMLPQSLLTQIGLQPVMERSIRFADGNEHRLGVGLCRIAWQETQFDCPVIFGPEDKYLMGATTLEIFDLAVELSTQKLVQRIHPERPYF